MRAITLTTWIGIAWLLSSIPAWGQTSFARCSEFGECFADVGQDTRRTDYNIYYHPFAELVNEHDSTGQTPKFAVPEDCTICDGRVDKDEAGYKLKIFSKDQDPTKGDLFDKPILVTQGFDAGFRIGEAQFDFDDAASGAPGFESQLSSVYDPKDGHLVCDEPSRVQNKCNETNLLRQLYDEGYDIALLLWKNPLIDIATNALVTLQALRWLDDHTNMREGSEPVVIGPSMGGLITRYALQLAGDQTAFPGIRARLFIAFDSPNRGAEIPMSLQALVSYFRDQGDDELQLFKNLTSVAARQLLLSSVKDKETGDVCQEILDYEAPNLILKPGAFVCDHVRDHAIFMQTINEPAFREQIKNIVHPSAGIIQPIHTAAIINGSGIGMSVGYTHDAHKYANQDSAKLFLELRGGSTPFDTPNPYEVFSGDKAPHFGTTLTCVVSPVFFAVSLGHLDNHCGENKEPLHYFFGEPAFVENAPGGLPRA